jgi:hypothetical protein
VSHRFDALHLAARANVIIPLMATYLSSQGWFFRPLTALSLSWDGVAAATCVQRSKKLENKGFTSVAPDGILLNEGCCLIGSSVVPFNRMPSSLAPMCRNFAGA